MTRKTNDFMNESEANVECGAVVSSMSRVPCSLFRVLGSVFLVLNRCSVIRI